MSQQLHLSQHNNVANAVIVCSDPALVRPVKCPSIVLERWTVGVSNPCAERRHTRVRSLLFVAQISLVPFATACVVVEVTTAFGALGLAPNQAGCLIDE